jgi:hypothetical protein
LFTTTKAHQKKWFKKMHFKTFQKAPVDLMTLNAVTVGHIAPKNFVYHHHRNSHKTHNAHLCSHIYENENVANMKNL